MSPRHVVAIVLLVVAAVVVGLSARHDSSATSFVPAPPAPRLCDAGSVTGPFAAGCTDNVGISGGSGLNLDSVATFNILAPDANFAGNIVFSSTDIQLTGGLSVGDAMGEVFSVATLGLLNQGCSSAVGTVLVNFAPFYEGSLDNSSGNLAPPSGTLAGDGLLINYREDDGDVDNDKTTSLTGNHTSQTTITVGDSTPFSVNDTILIETFGGTSPTSHTVQSFPSGTQMTVTPAVTANNGDIVVDPDNDGRAFDRIPDGVQWYPTYIDETLDPDGPGGLAPIVPTARYVGFARVANTTVVLHFLQLDAGDLTALPNGDIAHAGQGNASLTVLQNPLGVPNNSGISDFCTPLTTSVVFCGTEDTSKPTLGQGESWEATSSSSVVANGCSPAGVPTRALYPTTTGTREARQVSLAMRDKDGDGTENNMDPCPSTSNAGWDPRALNTVNFTAGWDADGDGIPNAAVDGGSGSGWSPDACDDFDNDTDNNGLPDVNNPACGGVPGATPVDADCDLWQNRLDNCPLVANASSAGDSPNTNQFDQDILYPAPVPEGNLGPRADAIGVDCDASPGTPDGHSHRATTITRICYTDAAGAPGANADDLDGDGVCNVADPNDASSDSDSDGVADANDNCMAVSNAPAAGQVQADTLMILPEAPFPNNTPRTGSDGVGDACDGVGEAASESDGDGVDDKHEIYIQTNHLIPCSMTAAANDEPHDPWPYDVNDNQIVGIDDVFFAAGRFNAAVGTALYTARAEVSTPNGKIGIDDIFAFAGRFNTSCTPQI